MSPLLEMRRIDKSFAGVHALQNVSLELRRGEVLALVGENGAGKSTLIKVLGGAHLPDRGEILIDGQPVSFSTPGAAQRAGITIIYQEFNLIRDLSVRENIFLGRELTRWGFVRRSAERRAAADLLATIGCRIDPDARCRNLRVSEQQKVEIAKALSANARIVVMDEPTAALSGQEAEQLFTVIRELRARGLGVIYVSHRLDEVFAIADRVLVLRDGAVVGCHPIGEVTRRGLIEMMVGRPLETEFPLRSVRLGDEVLRVERLSRGAVVRDVSFSIRRGEVLGLAGLAGAGRTETARLVFGADRADGGRIWVDGREASIRSPRDAIRHRICLLTEDRKVHGLILAHSVQHNFGLPNLRRFRRGPFVNQQQERAEFESFSSRLKLKSADPGQPAANLSGGNRQKLVLAKWLAANADSVIFDEPTRGIDVAAKLEIYRLINQLADERKAVLMISSEIPELLGMCDRILVMHAGRVRGEITDVARATQADILSYSID
ncbi:MAG: sugar ABC transporter ATP-binding protein [Pirellulales bacterium]